MKRSYAEGFIRFADAISNKIGQGVSYLYLLIIGVIIISVVLRYLFNLTNVLWEEIQWHLCAVAFLLGFAYAYAHNAHIRVDVLLERCSKRTQKWIELIGCLLLLLPWAVIMSWFSFHYFWSSFKVREHSPSLSGLPALYALKLFLFIAFLLLFMQGLSVAIKCIVWLWDNGYKRDKKWKSR